MSKIIRDGKRLAEILDREGAIRALNSVIDILGILRHRKDEFINDLSYLKSPNSEQSIRLETLIRLEDEVRFLCIDTYSVYEGITKKKSFFSKFIKQEDGKIFLKVDHNPSIDASDLKKFGYFEENGFRPASPEEISEIVKRFNGLDIQSREELKAGFGIASCKHEQLDKWINGLSKKTVINELESYRKSFAHRFNHMSKIEHELSQYKANSINEITNSIERMLEVISNVLTTYITCFQNMLVYTTAHYRSGEPIFGYYSLFHMSQRSR